MIVWGNGERPARKEGGDYSGTGRLEGGGGKQLGGHAFFADEKSAERAKLPGYACETHHRKWEEGGGDREKVREVRLPCGMGRTGFKVRTSRWVGHKRSSYAVKEKTNPKKK